MKTQKTNENETAQGVTSTHGLDARPIKFRARDFFNKEMFFVSRIDFENFLPDAIDWNDTNCCPTMACVFMEDNEQHFKLMQFTGLKDKNGIEIYEGDIVRYLTGNDDNPYIEEMVECRGGAFYPICLMPESEFEIIGNIFENPELLTGI